MIGYNLGVYYVFRIYYSAYMIHIIKSILLNIILVSVIGLLLGAIFALSLKRIPSYLMLILIIMVIGPVFDPIASMFSTIIKNLYNYLDFFRIFAPNLDWMPDPLYGIAIETCRWNIAYFWICILGAIFLYKTMNKKKLISLGICIALVTLAAINLTEYLQSSNDSVIRKDGRQIGILSADEYYWMDHEINTKEAEFNVSEYIINLNIGRKLQADVYITIQTSTIMTNYSFTLYRGYTIKRIVDSKNNPLQFSRDGDYLDIILISEKPAEKIHIEYEGNGGKYYSNYQGIALPGYFPYYPMPGYLALWSTEDGDAYVNTKFPEKSFTINIESPLHIASNLRETSKNNFTGVCGTVTLMGGIIEESESDGITYVYSPIGKPSFEPSRIKEYWGEVKMMIGETRDFSFASKKIFQIPATLIAASGSNHEMFVIFDDHILALNMDKQSLCANYVNSLIPYKECNQPLRRAFINFLWMYGTGSDLSNNPTSKPSYEPLEILKHSIQEADINNEIPAYLDAQAIYSKLFYYKVQTLGEDYAMKEIYRYLLNENSEMDEVDFLYNLGEVK
jgi:hypothetical protein